MCVDLYFRVQMAAVHNISRQSEITFRRIDGVPLISMQSTKLVNLFYAESNCGKYWKKKKNFKRRIRQTTFDRHYKSRHHGWSHVFISKLYIFNPN